MIDKDRRTAERKTEEWTDLTGRPNDGQSERTVDRQTMDKNSSKFVQQTENKDTAHYEMTDMSTDGQRGKMKDIQKRLEDEETEIPTDGKTA